MDLEPTVLNYLRNREFFNKIFPLLSENMFSDKGRVILSSIKELMERTQVEKIKCKEIYLYLSSSSFYNKEDLNDIKKFLKTIRRSKVSSDSVIGEIYKEFLEKSIFKESLERFIPYINKRGLLPIEILEEAVEYSKKVRNAFGSQKGFDFSKNLLRAQVMQDPRAVESPLSGISLFPGEVGIWAGGPKRGKTWALINTGYSALLQGKKVLHLSLEIPAEWLALRYDGRILQKPYKLISPEDSAKAVNKIKMLGGGSLIIEDRPEMTLVEIRNYLKENQFDLVIIDYADLLTPPKKFKERRHELLSIMQGLRKIAKEFSLPIWTASQLTAKSSQKKIASIEDLEEAKIGKAGTASLVLTLNQTPEEKEEGIMRIFVAASTRGVSSPVRTVECDFNSMVMREVKKNEKKKYN
ncbi:MAG: hypothetical protein K6T87_16120 [Roseiflexus sp.]|uniref:DnaB-like helicase C-terminal domain-containing protein n=1 Tax=Roseiflexus sp. TaxID=2562120 RepID=UPI0025F79C1D|nr:DnaB-like helicase C-terminal domain-containing protein [Roseiflexus sp.]MCL6542083.1 hypothetical protein [Roseiflexus sp.]